MYADHFNLRPYIRFNTCVNLVKKAPDYDATGRYTVRYQEKDKTEVEETFDAVMICSGHHWKPRSPTFPGQEGFKGAITHAHAYKDSKGFEGKHVAVVGVGNSGKRSARASLDEPCPSRTKGTPACARALAPPLPHCARCRPRHCRRAQPRRQAGTARRLRRAGRGGVGGRPGEQGRRW